MACKLLDNTQLDFADRGIMQNLKKQIVGLCSLVAAAAACASPTTFFREDQNPGQTVTTAVLNVRNSFTANLATSVQSYGFETALNGATAPLAVNFSGSGADPITATLQGSGKVVNTATAGRFNTTTGGSKYWQAQAGAVGTGSAGSFSIAFSTAISAFGFYATDVGDFEGSLSLQLTSTTGDVVTLAVPNTVGAANGSLLFFGFLDSATSYNKITFLTSGTSLTPDFFGFDDFIVADKGQILPSAGGNTPEPTSLALAGLALAAAGFAARRTRQA